MNHFSMSLMPAHNSILAIFGWSDSTGAFTNRPHMVQQAKPGHPGLPMGCAALADTIWTRHLRHNPNDPSWPERDRFILSCGAWLHLVMFPASSGWL
jgi:transketolase N-terminal domain/subunit